MRRGGPPGRPFLAFSRRPAPAPLLARRGAYFLPHLLKLLTPHVRLSLCRASRTTGAHHVRHGNQTNRRTDPTCRLGRSAARAGDTCAPPDGGRADCRSAGRSWASHRGGGPGAAHGPGSPQIPRNEPAPRRRPQLRETSPACRLATHRLAAGTQYRIARSRIGNLTSLRREAGIPMPASAQLPGSAKPLSRASPVPPAGGRTPAPPPPSRVPPSAPRS